MLWVEVRFFIGSTMSSSLEEKLGTRLCEYILNTAGQLELAYFH